MFKLFLLGKDFGKIFFRNIKLLVKKKKKKKKKRFNSLPTCNASVKIHLKDAGWKPYPASRTLETIGYFKL